MIEEYKSIMKMVIGVGFEKITLVNYLLITLFIATGHG